MEKLARWSVGRGREREEEKGQRSHGGHLRLKCTLFRLNAICMRTKVLFSRLLMFTGWIGIRDPFGFLCRWY